MNKRISFLALFAVGTLLLGLMSVIGALAAPSAADTGTVALDEAWYTTTGSFKITVNDDDLDIDTLHMEDLLVSRQDGSGAIANLGSGRFQMANLNLVGTPKLYGSAAARTAGTPEFAGTQVAVVSATLGVVDVLNASGGSIASDIEFFFAYKTSNEDTVKVKLISTQDTTTFIETADQVELKETGISTGIFEATVTLTSTASVLGPSPALKVLNGDTITVTYTDEVNAAGATDVKVSYTAKVETNPTLIANVVPTHEAATQLQLPVFTAVLNDSDSGVDVGNIYLLIDRNDSETIYYDNAFRRIKITGTDETALLPYFITAVLDADKLQDEVDNPESVGNIEIVKPAITGTGAAGSDVNITYTPAAVLGSEGEEGDIAWYVVAFDNAGNGTLSDSDSASTSDAGDPPLLDVDEPQLVRVDRLAPYGKDAQKGFFGIGNVLTGKYWDADDAVVKSNRKSSLQILFNEKLDSLTVSAADFTVDGLTPLTAEVFTKLQDSVFVTLATDMAPDAKPNVALVSAVADLAGNTRTSMTAIKASDKIEPKFTVTLDKTLTNKGIAITITSDEAISGNLPIVVLYKEDDDVNIEKVMPVVVTGSNVWKSEVTTSLNVANKDISVYVTGKDLSQNEGTKGEKDSDAAGSIVFEYDTVLGEPTFDPKKSLTTTLTPVFSSAPFVRAVYTEKVSITKAKFGEEGETLTDITSAMFSSDQKTWIYPASGLVVGTDYELVVDAEDLAGNTEKGSQTEFTVKERAKIEIDLVPGANLISLPGAPANGDINSVGLPSEVTSVITYDPMASGGPWLVATRGSGGSFSGTLSTMDSIHAYWVDTTSTAPIEVDIPARGLQVAPPAIPVVAGWNLVPIVVLNSDNLPADISADLYFGSVNWITAYSFDTAAGSWVKVLPNQVPANKVVPLNGYWLYAGSAGVLVP